MKRPLSRGARVSGSGSPSAHPQAAARVGGRYVLVEPLGAGGMGAVHLAHDEATGRKVAFKRLLTSLAGTKRRMVEAMFEREYHTLVRLKHPRVIEVYDYGITDAGPYYTMELLPGEDLQQRAPLPYTQVCALLRDVASLLALLGAQRLVHRDVSPRNVRFAADGRAKLIDFGALAAFGRAADIVGTPPCMAPEVLSRLGLDQRTDLYALGAVAYFALTGHHAYPARRLEDLPAMWQMVPAAPSSFASDIPPALDSLVLSLLRPDPLARPSNAAAVMDELCRLAQIPPDEHEIAAESYLQSGAIVGRKDEQDWLRRHVADVRRSVGGRVVIDGHAGAGKTRLLYEAVLEAQIQGIAVLSADGEATSEPFGVASALGLQLLVTHNELARTAAGAGAAVLGHLSGAVREKLGSPELAATTDVPSERRAQLQAALHAWFRAFAERRPLLIAVDNVHALDDNSAAFLAALGMEAKHGGVLVLCTQRQGDLVRSEAPVAKIRDGSAHLRLSDLSDAACLDLVQALLGNVPNAGRLASALAKRSGGNPLQFTDLVRLLVRDQVVRYEAGTWVLPVDVNVAELPRGVEALSDARLHALGADACTMLDVLSIHDHPVSLELCKAVADEMSPARTHGALAALLAEQLLILEDGRYRFARDAQQKARYERMPEALRVQRHRKAAHVLASRIDDPVALLDAGRHLLRAGDESAGAALIAPLGRRLQDERSDEELLRIVQALHAALRVYEREGRPPLACAEPMFATVGIAYLTSEWRLLSEYGVRSIELGCEILGLNRARRLRPFIGPQLALATAMAEAALRFMLLPKRSRGWHFAEGMRQFQGAVTTVCGTILLSHDVETLERLRRAIEPIGWFGPKHPLTFLYNFVREQTHMARGLLHLTIDDFDTSSAMLQQPAIVKALSEQWIRYLRAAMLCTMAILHSYRGRSAALRYADEAERMGVRLWQLGATQARLHYHALRGESELVQRYRAQLEVLAVQGGSSWQVELALSTAALGPEFLSADIQAVRHTLEQLSQRVHNLAALQPFVRLAEAMLLTLRDQLAEALPIYEALIPHFPPHGRQYWMLVRGAYAQALNRSGQHARARALLSDALQHTTVEDRQFVCLYLEGQRQLALSEAGLRHYAVATAQLDGLLAQDEVQDNPLLFGLLHKARAEVALMMEDRAAFERHFDALEGLFRATRNPALIAQADRLFARAVREGLHIPSEMTTADWKVVSAQLSQLHRMSDPFEHLLAVVVRHSRARAGFLYMYEPSSGMHLAASTTHAVPAASFAQLCHDAEQLSSRLKVGRRVADFSTVLDDRAPRSSLDATVAEDTTPSALGSHAADGLVGGLRRLSLAPPAPAEREGGSEIHRAVVLCAKHGSDRMVFGGLILELDPERALLLPPAMIEAVAAALRDRLEAGE